MGGVRKFMLVLAAALCAAVLAACGGDDDSTSSSGTDATSAGSTVAGGDGSADQSGDGNGGDGSQTGGKDGPGGGGGGDDSNGGSGGNGDGGSGGSGGGQGGNGGGSADIDFNGPPVRHDHPEPVDGQRSDGFRTPGGDNSIQEYGEEQDSEERAEAMKPIVALYRALESGDWTTVCSTYLSKPNVEQIKLLAEKSPKIKGSDCATVLSGLNQATGLRGPDTPDGEIVSFRTEDDTGFALWWGIDGKGYAMPLKSEDGAWKLTALAPTPLSFGT